MAMPNSAEEEVFNAARRISSAGERRAYLQRECGGDGNLQARIEALLQVYDQEQSFLQSPIEGLDTTEGRRDGERFGTIIGHYKLLEQIGEGGFGVVYMAEQQHPVRRRVALKVLKPGMDSRQVVARFEAERQALALMDHPNIAHVLDGGETEQGRPYFVMELVRGVPITEYCDRNHLPVRQRLELCVTACQAVQHAHQKGIIHRDIKPSNVLVTLHDGTPVVKIIDFGIAKATGQRLTEKTLFTNFALVVGTPLYMSPEQAEMSGLDIDTRTDIYALGVLLYELLTGTTPFDRERLNTVSFDELRRIIREEEPAKPSARISTVGAAAATVSSNRQSNPERLSRLLRGELDWIVMKCLEKDRTRRYATANGLARDLQRYLADEPVEACPPSAGYRLQKFARRNKRTLAVAALVFLAVTVMAASVGWAVRNRAAREAEIEHAESTRRAKVEGRVRDFLNVARTLVAENKLAAAREKLTQARAAIGDDASALADLAAEVQAGQAELDRFQQFLDLVDRAHEAETAPFLEPALADGSDGSAATPAPAGKWGRRPTAAVPFLLQALDRYDILKRDDWISNLERRFLEGQQIERIRRLAYEELLWLASDVLFRRQEHRSERTLSSEAAARQALVYLGKAELAHQPTQALYALRARCRRTLAENTAAQADTHLADQTPAIIALDHFLRGQAAYDAKQLDVGVRAFEAALRLEPTHYWSMMWLGYGLCDYGRGAEDFDRAVLVFTGCILKRPDHAHAYYCRALAYQKLHRHEEAVADFSRAAEFDPSPVAIWYSRGLSYNQLGRWEEAVADCSKAIEMDPGHARAWNNRGVAYKHSGQPDKAVADFSKAIELRPREALFSHNRGLAQHKLDQPEEAFADFSRAVELDPNYAPVLYSRARLYLDTGQPQMAVTDYAKAIELRPKSVEAWYGRGYAYNQLDQPDKAVADFSKAIELDRSMAKAWQARGNTLAKLGRLDQAVGDFSRSLELDSKDAKAWNNRGVVYHKLARDDQALGDFSKAIDLDPKYTDAWTNRGVSYERLGQSDKAVVDFTKAIELNPKGEQNWRNRGTTYLALAQADKALVDFSKAVELNPKFAPAWFGRGIAHSKLRQLDQAVADLSQAIELDPKDAEAWSHRGATYNRLDQPEKAVADLSKAIELDPKIAALWNNRGHAYARLDRSDQAVIDFSRSIELDRTSVSSWNQRAKVYFKLGQFDKAVADFSNVIELDPTQSGHWNNRGVAHNSLNQPEKAVADFSKALELDPTNIAALNNRGFSYDELGQTDKALIDFSKAIELNPKDALSWTNRGSAYVTLGQPDKALADCSRAIELNPKFALAWACRGRAYNRLGQPDKAVADCSRAIELNPKFATAWHHRARAYVQLGQMDKAVADSSRAVELSPKNGDYWRTLGVAHYRAGDWKAAEAAFCNSSKLQEGESRMDGFYLAMVRWKAGDQDEARKAYQQAVEWLEKNKEALEKKPERAEELRRLRVEAEQVLELKKR